jgi:catalase
MSAANARRAQAADKISPDDPLIQDLLKSFHEVFGLHPGFRPVHAKGLMLSGTFTPSAEAKTLTRAPHILRPSTRVIVRFSDFAGVPTIPDNHPEAASPRGMAVRFYLGEHQHTDIVAHSADGFPVRTGEEFLEFNRAVAASVAPSPPAGEGRGEGLQKFLAAHPRAMQFVVLPKPFPTSFAREHFFSAAAYKFTSADGTARFGRYRLKPAAGTEYLTDEEAAKKSPNYLFDEIDPRLVQGPINFRVVVQLAAPGDPTDDSSITWPNDRPEIELGTITLTKRENDLEPELHKIIFDPLPRVDGIEPSGDPLLHVRAALYLASGRRRRAATT